MNMMKDRVKQIPLVRHFQIHSQPDNIFLPDCTTRLLYIITESYHCLFDLVKDLDLDSIDMVDLPTDGRITVGRGQGV